MKRLIQGFGGILAVLLLVACAEDDAAQSISCTGDSDCPTGQFCDNGTCAPEDSNTDGDGYVPPDGDGAVPECYENFDCDPGLICKNGKCVIPGSGDEDDDTEVPTDGDDSPTDGDDDAIDGDDDSTDEDNAPQPCQSNADCDDGFYCNGTETCGLGSVCSPGVPPCDDQVACTENRCDEDSDTCFYVADHTRCDNGNQCDGTETCDETLGCQTGEAPVCDDETDCTLDRCDPVEGCVYQPDHSLCEDSTDCNEDLCVSGEGCTHPTVAGACDDSVDCTEDSCLSGQGCRNMPVDSACNDDIHCTMDICHPTAGCDNQTTHALCAEDEMCDPTSENADPTTGCKLRPQCETDPDCDDGRWCNGVETCVDQICIPGTSIDCADTVDCTNDICNDDLDICMNLPDNGFCSDSNPCNGEEVCHATDGCQAGTPIDCNDGFDCTSDSCQDGVGCQYIPDDDLCAGDLVCEVGVGCTDPPECYNDNDCDDGNVCNGIEICVNGECEPGPDYCEQFLTGNHDRVNCTTECVFSCENQYVDCNNDLGNPNGNGCERHIPPMTFGQNNPVTGNTCTGGANNLNGYSCSSYPSQMGYDMVYQWTATASDRLYAGVEATGSGLDPDIFILTDACNPNSAFACDAASGESYTDFNVTSGTTYYFVVDALGSDECGGFRMGIEWYDNVSCETTGNRHMTTFLFVFLMIAGFGLLAFRRKTKA